MPHAIAKTPNDWRHYIRVCLELVCGYCSIHKDHLARLGVTVEQILEGLPYEYVEGKCSFGFRKKGEKTSLHFGRTATKAEKHEAEYVWKSLL